MMIPRLLLLMFVFLFLLTTCQTNSSPTPSSATTTVPPEPSVAAEREENENEIVEPVVGNEEDEEDVEDEALQSDKGQIVIGGRDYTEHLVLNQIAMMLLEDAGYEVVDSSDLGGGTHIVRDAINQDIIDLYWEYTGTALAAFHELPPNELPSDVIEAWKLASKLDAEEFDLIWMAPAAFNDTYTLMVNPAMLDVELQTLEELAAYMNEDDNSLTLCVENDFYSREDDGIFPLLEHYGFAFEEEQIQIVAYDQLYDGLRDGSCDVAEGFSTDGRIGAWGFHNLEDTLAFFPAYNVAPIIRREVLEAHPEVQAVLERVGPHLNDEVMTLLNARVDVGADGERKSGDEETPAAVARDFLAKAGLLGEKPQVVVGARDYTEQLVLIQIATYVLEDAGYDVVDRSNLGGGTQVVRDAINDDLIDLYWEYTGTALAAFHQIPPVALPSNVDVAWAQASSLDARHYQLIWLASTAFNDTYTLMVTPERLTPDLKTIDDLADYMNANDAPLTLCVENDFYSREEDGLVPLQKHYDFAFEEEKIQLVAYDYLYEGLRDGSCDVAEGFSTDGRISAWGFRSLEDTRHFFPAYNAAPVVREELLKEHPDLELTLEQLGPLLTDEVITQLNARVDVGMDGEQDSGDEESVAAVAEIFLCTFGLRDNCPTDPTLLATLDISSTEEVVEEEEKAEFVEDEEQIVADEEQIVADEEQIVEDEQHKSTIITPTSFPRSTPTSSPISTPTSPPRNTPTIEVAEEEQIIEEAELVCQNVVLNGDFEVESEWVIPRTTWPAEYSTTQVHQGKKALRLGLPEDADDIFSHSAVIYRMSLPADAESATLSFWAYPTSRDLVGGDSQGLMIYDQTLSIAQEKLWWTISNEQAWTLQSYDVSHLLGQEIILYFVVINDGDGLSSNLYLDEVTVEVCAAGSEEN